METALKKKMEQVKELFDSCTEVFQELLSVRAHLFQRIDTCQTAIQRIHSSVRMLSADNKDLLQQHLQVLQQMMSIASTKMFSVTSVHHPHINSKEPRSPKQMTLNCYSVIICRNFLISYWIRRKMLTL